MLCCLAQVYIYVYISRKSYFVRLIDMMSTAGRRRTRKEKPALAHDGFMYRFDRHSVDDVNFGDVYVISVLGA